MRFFIIRKRKNNLKTSIFNRRQALILMLAFATFFSTFALASEKDEAKEKVEAREVFSKLQTQALDILPVSTRLDMLDYWDADSTYKASNVMEGLSWIENLNPGYMKIRLTGVSTLEIKVLPAKKGELIMTVYSVGASPQATDSQVDFYDASLNKLETGKYLEIPSLDDFFEIPKGSLTKMKEIKELIPFPTVAYSVAADADVLYATLTVEDYLSQDDLNVIKLFLKRQITSEWKKEKFKFK